MNLFDKAIEYVLKHEGGFVDHSLDPGGATNFGVTLVFLKAAGLDIDFDGSIDKKDILALDKKKAKEIYKKYIWDKYRYEDIKDKQIAIKVFDLSVNMGAKQAHILLQRAVNRILKKDYLKVDGILGDLSIQKINELAKDKENYSLPPSVLFCSLKNEANEFYYGLVRKNNLLSCFLKGWLSRVKDPISL